MRHVIVATTGDDNESLSGYTPKRIIISNVLHAIDELHIFTNEKHVKLIDKLF